MNKFIAIGRLAADPELKYTTGENATAIASFRLAVDRRFKREGQPEADFFRCQAFGKVAETICNYLHKGSKILIEGRVEINSYTNKEGQKVYTTDVTVENFEFAESKSAENANGGGAAKSTANASFMNIPDGTITEDLPFV